MDKKHNRITKNLKYEKKKYIYIQFLQTLKEGHATIMHTGKPNKVD